MRRVLPIVFAGVPTASAATADERPNESDGSFTKLVRPERVGSIARKATGATDGSSCS